MSKWFFQIIIITLFFVGIRPCYAENASCNLTVGKKQADLYVNQCTLVSPATHPPCSAKNECALITDEIQRGCKFLADDAPIFCKFYAANVKIRTAGGLVSKACANSNTQIELDTCITSEEQKTDRELDKVYQKLLNKAKVNDASIKQQLDNEDMKLRREHPELYVKVVKYLDDSQKSWAVYREKECAFATNHKADAVLPLLKADCKIALTRERIKRLYEILECNDGAYCPLD